MLSTWVISQTIKYTLKTVRHRDYSLKTLKQTYLYSSGIPSTHSAILSSSLFFIAANLGTNHPIFYIFTLFSILWIYEIYQQRKRYHLIITFFDHQKINKESLAALKDLNGHDKTDIILGIVLGAAIFFFFTLLRQI
jgi:acid phosphatase family membrane protein YuiD